VSRLRRFIGWLRSPGSPSDYPEADIATHRSIARLNEWLGYLALVGFVAWLFVANPTNAEIADAVVLPALIFAVTHYVARGLRMTALRWQVEEMEKDHDFRMTELRRQIEDVQEEQDLMLSKELDEERGEDS
jgi:hypothetical protein